MTLVLDARNPCVYPLAVQPADLVLVDIQKGVLSEIAALTGTPKPDRPHSWAT